MAGKTPGQPRPYRSLWQREKSNQGTQEVEFNAFNQGLEDQKVAASGESWWEDIRGF